MNILIIGGSGFIGSYTARRLYIDGHKITIADIRAPHRPNLLNIRHEYIHCDVNDEQQVSEVIKRSEYDVVYLLAGVIRAEDVREDPIASLNTNIVGLVNCLNACRDINLHRFVFSSTTHLYNCE